MNKLINIKNENGKNLVSLRELYFGLGLQRTNLNNWVKTNILENEFFHKNYDWMGCMVNIQGNECQDYSITIEFAKHIAMMAKTEKSHQYRNYFLICEEQTLKSVQPKLSKELQAIIMLDQKNTATNIRMDKLENDMPLFNIECKELQALVRKIATKALGGYKTPAYIDKSMRSKVYSDLQKQIRREFDIKRYEAIKHSQLDIAREIISTYRLPMFLQDDITLLNNQIEIPFSDLN